VSATTDISAVAPQPAASLDRFYPARRALEAGLAPLFALVVAGLAFCVFLLALGQSPADFIDVVWRGAFGSWFSLQNTAQRAAPLLLTALCVAIPAQLGLVVIGGEAAVALGGLAGTVAAWPIEGLPAPIVQIVMMLAGMVAGGVWIGLTGYLRAYRGINETVASLVLAYIGIAVFNQLVETVFRDPSSLNKPSTWGIGDQNMMGNLPWLDMHPGMAIGVVACIASWVLISRSSIGFAARVTGGNLRAAQLQGMPVARLIMMACLLGGAFAGLSGSVEVMVVHGRANASLIAGYGYAGILISFLARHNPLAIIPMAILVGGIGAAGGLLQRRMDMPDATVAVLEGFIFVAILASESLQGRIAWFQPRGAR
jgi:simple sugar transport system permease protein